MENPVAGTGAGVARAGCVRRKSALKWQEKVLCRKRTFSRLAIKGTCRLPTEMWKPAGGYWRKRCTRRVLSEENVLFLRKHIVHWQKRYYHRNNMYCNGKGKRHVCCKNTYCIGKKRYFDCERTCIILATERYLCCKNMFLLVEKNEAPLEQPCDQNAIHCA